MNQMSFKLKAVLLINLTILLAILMAVKLEEKKLMRKMIWMIKFKLS
jgi:hypothetical protein